MVPPPLIFQNLVAPLKLKVPDVDATLVVVELFLELIRRQLFSVNEQHHLVVA